MSSSRNEFSVEDSTLDRIKSDLVQNHSCHTVILYGSRARGDFTATSDYDILGVSDIAPRVMRHAYESNGAYVDGFIYPTADLESADESHLYMRDGKVLLEREGFGFRLLSRLNAIFDSPVEVRPDEIAMKKIWSRKMIERAKRGDIEGLYRKHWLIYSLLEDYFTFRSIRYEGSKKALQYLKANDVPVYEKFEAVVGDPQTISLLEALADLVAAPSELHSG